MNKRILLNKRNLSVLVRDKGNCGYVNCNGATCSTCVCRYSTSSVYSFALNYPSLKGVKQYPEERSGYNSSIYPYKG